jgi:hypothetical protein
MLTFREFIKESASGVASAKHQEHPEDNAVKSKEGFAHSLSALKAVHHGLKSGNSGETHISTKLDGAPAFLAMRHPKTGAAMVATKHSALGKNPRWASSHEDVKKHFGHSEGLAKKMGHLLNHVGKVLPAKKGVAYQGDYMHDSHNLHHTDHDVSFKPNTIRYHVKKDTKEGNKAVKSKIGIAFHTQFAGNHEHPETMHAHPIKDHSVFKKHPDVHLISPEAKLKHE